MLPSTPLTKTARLASHIQRHAWRMFVFVLTALVLALGAVTAVSAARLYAPTIIATKTDVIIDDGVPLSEAADGKADPGETIEYTVSIPNSALPGPANNATGVTFTDTIDSNTTLVVGSLNVSPLAFDDSYETIGNTLLDVGVGVPDPAVHVAAGSLFTNDTEFLTDTFTLKSVEGVSGAAPITSGTEAPGAGSVTVQANGSFTYIPPVGFSGTDNFDYVITDDGPDNILGNADDLTGMGRVTITVTTERVWYVKNNAAAGGLGRSTDPFDTLTEAQTASAVNDTIYVFTGSGTTGQDAGISLKSGQRLLGEGVALTVPVASVASFNGTATPTTINLRVAGTRPTITNTAGNGVTVSTGAPLNASFSNVLIRGLDISASGAGNNAVDVSTTGAFSGSFELADNVISGSGAGAEGIDVNGGGTGVAGLTVSLHDNTITATGNGIDIQRTAGSVTVTTFDDNVVMGNTGGIGINVVGSGATVLFDSNPDADYDVVSGGVTAIGSSGAGNGVGTSGMILNNVTGDIGFTDLDIYADAGNALLINGTTPNFNAAGAAGFRLVASGNNGTFAAIGGAALDVTEANINIVPSTFTSSISTAIRGVSLVNVSGTLTAPAGSTITSTSATGTGFFVDGSGGFASTSNVNVTYPGTITADIGRLVQIQNVNPTVAATYTFSGAITDNNDGDGNEQGILLDNNDNGTVTFSGGLAVRTTGNAAFTATNGGTVNATQNNTSIVNTLTSTTGTALNVNATIGASDLTFRSISSNGAANGIVLNTTGGSGNLIVTGNGGSCTSTATCTGGAIQNSTGHAISLTSTTSPSFTRIAIQNAARSGIDGQQVTDFTLANSFIDNVGTGATGQYEESNISFNDNGAFTSNSLSGVVSITNNTLTNARRHGVQIENGTGTISNLTISNNTLTSSTNSAVSLGTAILALIQGSAATTAHLTTGTISGNIITNFPSGEGIAILGGSGNGSNTTSSTLGASGTPINITNNTISGQVAAAQHMGSNAIRASINTQVGVMNFNIACNGNTGGGCSATGPITNIQGQGISVFAGGTITGTTLVNNNVIVANQTLGAGTQGLAVQVDDGPAGAGTSAADYNMVITNNNVTNYEGFGIRGIARASLGKMDITIQNNSVGTPILTNRNGIRVDSGSAVGDVTVCMLMTGNTSDGSGVNQGIGIRKQGTVAGTNEFGIVGLSPSPTTAANAAAKVATDNPAGGGVDVISGDNFVNCAVTAMSPESNRILAQAQPEISSVTHAQAAGATSNVSQTFTVASGSAKLSKQTVWAKAPASLSTTGGSSPRLLAVRPAPLQSGETVTVSLTNLATPITLPAGKALTIKFRVMVDDPIDNPVGDIKVENQGTIHYNYSGGPGGGVDVFTANAGTVDCESGVSPQKTCTPIDRPDANVNSINRLTPLGANTNADTVTWRVTFDTPVGALTASNFALATTGTVTTGAIGAPAPASAETPPASGRYTTWDVSVGTIAGDGTLGLNMDDDIGLTHDVFVLTFIGQTYTIDNIAPTTTSFTCFTPACVNPTNADTLIFRASFSEDVTNVGPTGVTGDFTVTGTTATVTSIGSGDSQNFDITVSGGNLASLDGTVGLNFNSGNLNITDLAGNALASTEPTTDETYTVDNTAPSTVSFTRLTPTGMNTNADTLVFQAIFSENVTGVDTTDFDPGGTTAAVTLVTGSGTTYDLTVSGGDLAGLNGVVDMDFNLAAPAAFITDLAGNNLPKTEPSTDEIYVVDNTAPSTIGFLLQNPSTSPTNADTLVFRAHFSEDVLNVDTNDFAVGGVPAFTTATITNVSLFSSGLYDVTVSGGDLAGYNGVVGLNLNTGSLNITDLAGNPLPGAEPSVDNTYTVDNTAPTVTINQAGAQADPTATSPINFTVVFSEAVSDFDDAADVTLSGGAGATTAIITGGPTTYNVAVSGMTGDGTVIADVPASAAQDATGNTNTVSTSTDNSVLYDTVVPSVTINQAGAQADPTNASPINFTVVFSEAVTDFDDATDVTLSGGAGATTAIITGGPTTYNVAVSGMTGDGTVIADVPASAAQDAGGNDNTASTSTDKTVTYDTTAPTVTINQAGAQADPTNASPINFTVVFSEAVTDFDDAADVTLSGGAGATTAIITGGPTTYNVAVSGMTGDGTVIADVPASAAQDAAGNNNAASTSTDKTVTYDATAPTVTINQAGAQADPAGASPINFTVVFSEAVSDFDDAADVTLSGGAGATTVLISGGPTTYNVAVSGMTGDGTVIADVPASAAQDAAGNNNAASTSTDNSVLYDTVVPSVTINQAGAQADPTNASPINFTVVFSEAVSDFDDAADVTLSGTAGATTAIITGGPTTYNVAVSGMTGAGTVIAAVPAGAAQDGASQLNTASTSTDKTVTYDGTAPTVTINQAGAQADPTNANPINFTVVFSEAVTDFDDAADVTLSGSAGATTAIITGGPTTYNVAVSGMTGAGTVIADVPAGAAMDVVNLSTASTSTDKTVTYDATAPTVTINQAGAQADPTNASPINFTVVFSEAVSDFDDAADITLSGSAGATTAIITGGPTTYNVSVSGMTGDGTVIADVPASAAQDAAGNLSTASTSTDKTVTYDTTAPTVVLSTLVTSPTNTSPILVTVTFSEPVNVGPGPGAGDIAVTNGTASVLSGGPTVYTFNLTPTADGLVTAKYLALTALDLAGNANTSDSNTLSITYDTVSPTVTIEDATPGQPTSTSPINFTAVFSEAISLASFTGTDITLSGTANPASATVTQIAPMNGTTFNVAVSGMTATGTVIADILAGVTTDLAGNPNAASTSVDNSVDYIYAAPPIITEGPMIGVTMSEDGNPTPFSLNLNATDGNGDSLTWSIISPASFGTAGVSATPPGNLANVSYTPLPNYNGPDTFVVEVSDGALTDSITVNVTVEAVGDNPDLIWNQNYGIQYDTWLGTEDINAFVFASGYRKARSGTFTVRPKTSFTSFKLITYRGPDQGKAQIYVDGVLKKTVDLYSATAQWQYQVEVKGLSNTKHTIVVKPNGKNPASSDKWVTVDGFKIKSTTYDDDYIGISGFYSYGSWIGLRNNGARFKAYRLSNVKNASMKFSFDGVQFNWVTARGPKYGKAQIWVDGVLNQTVDLYRAKQQWQYEVSITGLTYGTHNVEIRVLHTKNSKSTGFGIVSDGFEID